MVNSAAEAYKKQQVLTATPEALTLMLYNGCLKFIKEGVDALAEKKYENANICLQKAQNIISEFRVTLNMDYEISHQLLPLYNYKAYEAAQSLWEKYRVLTHELMKFIDEEEIDTFIDLVDQRERIVDMLKELPADPYRGSEEWGALDAEIRPLEMQIQYKARAWLNRSRRQNAAVHSYDLTEANPLGGNLNRRY